MARQAEVSLRPELPADFPFLEELVFAVRESEPGFRHLLLEERTRLLKEQALLQHRDYRTRFSQAHFLIIMVEESPVGRFYVDHQPDHLRLVELSLLPAYQNHGIGRHLLLTLQAEASRTQIPVVLSVAMDNPARSFYEKLGFRKTDSTETHHRFTWHPTPPSS